MNINLFAIGKVREKFIKLGVNEFKKRLQPYCNLSLHSVREEQVHDSMSEAEINHAKKIEGEKILQRIKPNAYTIALDLRGKQFSSEQFASRLEQISFQGKNNVTFIIGGANGLSEEVIARANETISFSKMTFPHQLMQLILLEQLYRAFKIQRGEPYHK
ncbi:MAG TPA: 23S rRNA (pseudouridine(1915)-N(3))-methyltransferase RlmH [Pseudogracilibacillus sp.]|nr:23S rRNA (pseudouridine(1915)-N(3))-methyltransferase RlmH [Pseudogracilibacillus sp.]